MRSRHSNHGAKQPNGPIIALAPKQLKNPCQRRSVIDLESPLPAEATARLLTIAAPMTCVSTHAIALSVSAVDAVADWSSVVASRSTICRSWLLSRCGCIRANHPSVCTASPATRLPYIIAIERQSRENASRSAGVLPCTSWPDEMIEPTADANSCAARVLFAAALAFLAKLGCCCEWRSSRTACRHFQNFGGGMSIGPSCSVPLLQRSSLHDCRSTAQIASKPAVPPAASTAPQLRRNCAKRPGCDTRLASMNVPSCTTSACRPSSKQMPNSISTACRSGAMPTLLNSGRSSMHASMCALASARVSPATQCGAR
ncbi:hypothetical protein BC831DRAFT_284726 [Entophlyctis helioformis]|nr:hypothetical protein BC831DRAFT_284726 [Entophlyctis helioformis]